MYVDLTIYQICKRNCATITRIPMHVKADRKVDRSLQGIHRTAFSLPLAGVQVISVPFIRPRPLHIGDPDTILGSCNISFPG